MTYLSILSVIRKNGAIVGMVMCALMLNIISVFVFFGSDFCSDFF